MMEDDPTIKLLTDPEVEILNRPPAFRTRTRKAARESWRSPRVPVVNMGMKRKRQMLGVILIQSVSAAQTEGFSMISPVGSDDGCGRSKGKRKQADSIWIVELSAFLLYLERYRDTWESGVEVK